MTKEEKDTVAPLTHTLSKLTYNEFVVPKTAKRERSKSLTFETPETRTIKPLPSAFNSTGILSKKNRMVTKHQITPETPIKAKTRGLFKGGDINPVPQSPSNFFNRPSEFSFNNSFCNTPIKQKPKVVTKLPLLGNTPVIYDENPIKTNRLSIKTPQKSIPNETYTPQKATGFGRSKFQINTPFKKPTKYQSMELGKTPQVQIQPKSEKLHNRSPLKESPTKRLHLDKMQLFAQVNRDSPPNDSKVFFSKLTKNRLRPVQNTIPFSTFISTSKINITFEFFSALNGMKEISIEPNVDNIDYFETMFELVGRVGNGAFADAFHVQSLVDLKDYAIKKTRQPFTGVKDAYFKLIRIEKLEEVRMLLHIGYHPNCVCLKDAWIQYGYLYIQTQLCIRGK
jgi:hypothetical protein